MYVYIGKIMGKFREQICIFPIIKMSIFCQNGTNNFPNWLKITHFNSSLCRCILYSMLCTVFSFHYKTIVGPRILIKKNYEENLIFIKQKWGGVFIRRFVGGYSKCRRKRGRGPLKWIIKTVVGGSRNLEWIIPFQLVSFNWASDSV